MSRVEKSYLVVAAGVLTLMWVITFAGCRPKPPVPPPGTPTCETACRRLAELGCPGAQPTPEGADCVMVCRSLTGSGVVRLDLACRTNAASCEAIDRCEAL